MLYGRRIIGTVAYLGGVMTLPEPFVNSWSQMLQYNGEYFLENQERLFYTRSTVSYHSFARNTLVEHMQGDWLLQLDTDITFEPDLLARMINKMDRFGIDVLCGMYLYKTPPHPPVLYGWDPKLKAKVIIGDWQKSADLIPIKGAGGGCLLVRKSVFDKLHKKFKCSPFDILMDGNSPLSEDHSFFERCWQAKIPVYAAPDIFVKHLLYRELDPYKDYDKKNLNIKRIDRFKL